MFIDDKIKEYIEHEKKEWQACKELWEKIKDEIKSYINIFLLMKMIFYIKN